jgi:IMP dehydrogenase
MKSIVKGIILAKISRKYNLFMPILIKSNALTFDDVLLVPQYSEIASRKEVDLSTNLLGMKLTTPICSANMDTVTEVAMANTVFDLGGIGFLHRYAPHESVLKWIKEIHNSKRVVIPSIGVKPEDFDYAMAYANEGVLGINVDVAHGDSAHTVQMVERLAKAGINVIAGNVATKDGTLRLVRAGAKAIKVGIGPGSLCTTRIVTGHGVPQLTAIEECAAVKRYAPVSIIADGGIRNAGDCVKALAFGADMVMVGSLFAGTNESPGEATYLINDKGLHYHAKQYRGMASRAARNSVAQTDSSYTPEGEATYVELKGPVKEVIEQLVGGMRSGFSYSGALNLKELQEYAQYVTITSNGMAESKPHLITR